MIEELDQRCTQMERDLRDRDKEIGRMEGEVVKADTRSLELEKRVKALLIELE